MSAATIAVEVLVWVAVLTCLICCLGIAVMKDFFERLHYMATVSTVATVALLIAVVIQQGWGQAAIKMSLIVVVLFLMNAVLTHATARAARVRELGHWQPAPDEKIEGLDQITEGRHQR
ncbi:MAG TPA: monovalent cation/H(+) antiporter subunit G [Terriglobales bacterium]|jgi:multicomponent Na+:H+ antiporter subunit G|nr:monovalent cation/H(+) antiporter subunit G [Terriglobales bacterium]